MFNKKIIPVRHLNRTRKALMIEAFLEDVFQNKIKSLKILDVGCGNGQIANYFAQKNDCYGVDIQKQFLDKNCNFTFQQITNEILPFKDNTFDVVLSHHVIEHVENQQLHLTELSRVINQNGIIYLACPNKSSAFMKGHIGNDKVLRYKELINLLQELNFSYVEFYTRFLSNPSKYHCPLYLGKIIPSSIISLFKPWYPSQCYLLKKQNN
ncbi:MAG: methyltransferase domain-containing protein [Colwellia sp.]|nr:methyltransferase domain-containing protein [Colwellia sp.]